MLSVEDFTTVVSVRDIEFSLLVYPVQTIPARSVQVDELGNAMHSIVIVHLAHPIVSLLVVVPSFQNLNNFKRGILQTLVSFYQPLICI